MQKDKINAAIIGCGNISTSHARAIKANSGRVCMYAVCDIVEERARKLGEEYGAQKIFTNYRQMLEDKAIDLVCICTPSGMHADMAVDCARAGKHVLCEKPLDITGEKLDLMIGAFSGREVKLGSVFQYRTYQGLVEAKEMLEKGELGKILFANGYCKIYRSPEYYKSAGWRGTWAVDGGGCLMNQAIHTLDVLCWLAGGAISVRSEVYTLARDIEVEDTAYAFLKFKNNVPGAFEATTLATPGIGVKVEIQCEKGRLEFTAPETTLYKTGENGESVAVLLGKGGLQKGNTANDPGALANEGHSFLVDDMADVILTGKEPYVPATMGRHAVDVILAIYRSSREKREITI